MILVCQQSNNNLTGWAGIDDLRSMIYDLRMSSIKNHKELEERLIKFSIDVLKLVKILPKTTENIIYGRQVIRSSSSMGANYMEATCAHTRMDFLHGINLCRKEGKETHYWLILIREANSDFADKINPVLDESQQLLKIFISSVKTTKEGVKLKNKNHK